MTRTLDEVCASTLKKARLYTHAEMLAEADSLYQAGRVSRTIDGETRFNAAWRKGCEVGVVVTTALLGGAVVFIYFIGWLGNCA